MPSKVLDPTASSSSTAPTASNIETAVAALVQQMQQQQAVLMQLAQQSQQSTGTAAQASQSTATSGGSAYRKPIKLPDITLTRKPNNWATWRVRAGQQLQASGCWAAISTSANPRQLNYIVGTADEPQGVPEDIDGEAFSYLMAFVSPDLMSVVQLAKTAAAAWRRLQDMFEESAAQGHTDLLVELMNFSMRSSEGLDNYQARLVSLQAKMTLAGKPPEEVMLVAAFMKGLSSEYATDKKILKSRLEQDGSLSLDRAYRLLKRCNDDAQQKPRPKGAAYTAQDTGEDVNPEESGDQAHYAGRGRGRGRGRGHSNNSAGGRGGRFNRGGHGGHSRPRKGPPGSCFKCGKMGHLKADCPELRAAPHQQQEHHNRPKAMSAAPGEVLASQTFFNPSTDVFRVQQTGAFVASVSNASASASSTASLAESAAERSSTAAASTADADVQTVAAAAGTGSARGGIWILDSGASRHITGDRSLLRKYTPVVSDQTIEFGNGQHSYVSGTGEVQLQGAVGKVTLKGVWHVPDAQHNLVSISQAIASGLTVSFAHGTCTFKAGRRTVMQAQKSGSLWTATTVPVPLSPEVCGSAMSAVNKAVLSSAEARLWHKRLAHLGPHNMIAMVKGNMVEGMPLSMAHVQHILHDDCTACKLSKLTRPPFPSTGSVSSRRLQLVHTDVCGPLPEALGGERYFLTLLDDYSKLAVVCILDRKSDAAAALQRELTRLETSSGCKTVAVRSDGGGEYLSHSMQQWFEDKGIQHQLTTPYTPQQNGAAERLNRTLLDKVRAMLVESQLPDELWPELVKTATHIRNRSPVTGLQVTPFEAFMGCKPNVSHLRQIGCKAYIVTPKEKRDNKLQPVAQQGRLVGYSMTRKAHRVLLDSTGEIVEGIVSTFVESAADVPAPAEEQLRIRLPVEAARGAPLQGAPLRQKRPGDKGRTDVLNQHQEDVDSDEDTPAGEPAEVSTLLHSAPSVPAEVPSTGFVQHGSPHIADTSAGSARRVLHDLQHVSQSTGQHAEQHAGQHTGQLHVQTLQQRAPRIPRAAVLRVDRPVTRRHNAAAELQPPPSIPVEEADAEGVSDEGEGTGSAQHSASTTPRAFINADTPDERTPEQLLAMISLVATALQQKQQIVEPGSYKEAVSSPQRQLWQQAMDEEIQSCLENCTWDVLQDCPRGANILPVKWVFKVKRDERGFIERFKARLVAKGFKQIWGRDYVEVYAPVSKHTTVKVVLAIAAILDWELHQLDVTTAFLQGELQEVVYIRPPEGYAPDGMPHAVYRLRKPLYGLKQAPRAWHSKLLQVLQDIGFTVSDADAALFILAKDGGTLYLVAYVDDLLMASKLLQLIEWAKQQIMQVLKLRDMGEAKLFLGMEIKRCRQARTLELTQHNKIKELLTEWRMDQCKPSDVPLSPSLQLDAGDGEPLSGNMHAQYQAVVGSLIYLSICTRPDIAYAVHKLTRAMQAPTQPHWKAAMQVLRYLAGTADMGLKYGPTARSQQLQCYHDADYGGDKGNKKSTTGWVYLLGGAAVAWSSKLQPFVTLSTTESEYVAAAMAIKEGLWMIKLYSEFTGSAQAVQLWGDNQPCITVLKNKVVEQRTKHIDIQYKFVHERLARGEFIMDYCPTQKMVADILTKALPAGTFNPHRDMMGLVHVTDIGR